MRVLYPQHVPFEGLGRIEAWTKEMGCEPTRTRFYESSRLPEEKAFVRQVVESGKAVLDIRLGVQRIAAALGARVYRNPNKGIGWFPVRSLHGPGISSGRNGSRIAVSSGNHPRGRQGSH